MADELLPCPFCGCTDLEVVHWTMDTRPNLNSIRYSVGCQNPNCNAFGPIDLGESGATEAWNKKVCTVREVKNG